MPSAVLTLLVWATMQSELPGNHLLQAEPMSATDCKPLTATLDPCFESSGATFVFYTLLISCQLNVCQEEDLSLL